MWDVVCLNKTSTTVEELQLQSLLLDLLDLQPQGQHLMGEMKQASAKQFSSSFGGKDGFPSQ